MKNKFPILLLVIIMAATVFCIPSLAMADTNQAENIDESMAYPSNVKAEVISYNAVKLTWDAEEGATGYKIFSAEKEDGTYKEIVALDSNKTEYRVSGLLTGKKMYYKVSTIMGNKSAKTMDCETNDDLTSVPTIEATPVLSNTVVSGYAKTRITVKVQWKKVAGAQGYIIYKYNTKTKKYVRIKMIKNSSTRNYTQRKQIAGETYRYLVKAYRKNAGITSYSKDSGIIRTPKKLTMKTQGFWKTNSGKVIKLARTKLGTPYVWGASGPRSFDCSGFACWTLKNSHVAGVNLPRLSSRTLYRAYNKKYGLGKNLSVAQPGDIIIMGYGGSSRHIFHVGIYYNAGKYIHATTGGRGVTISEIPKSMVVAIIRMPGLE